MEANPLIQQAFTLSIIASQCGGLQVFQPKAKLQQIQPNSPSLTFNSSLSIIPSLIFRIKLLQYGTQQSLDARINLLEPTI